MRFLAPSECAAWVSPAPVPGQSTPFLSVQLPPESGRLLFIARHIATAITFREPCLLHPTEWDIWTSSNNWHLYYRLRQSYGDLVLIEEAPGHLFLGHESEDLATFLHIAMSFGWDAELKPRAPYVSARLSHDGFVEIYSDNLEQLAEFGKVFEGAKLPFRMRP